MNQNFPNQPQPLTTSQEPKSKKWLWIIFVIMVIIGAAFFIWQYVSNISPTSTTTPTTQEKSTDTTSDDLSNADKDLQSMDNDFNSLDKVDTSNDDTLNL